MLAEKLLKIIPEFASVPEEDRENIYNTILEGYERLHESIVVTAFTRELMSKYYSYHNKYIDLLMEETAGDSMLYARIGLLNEARDILYENVKVYLPDLQWIDHPPELTEDRCHDCGHRLYDDERYRCHDCKHEEQEFQMYLWRQEERRYY